MFTGLIETIGRVADVSSRGGITRLAIESALTLSDVEIGESICVDGVCLTVTSKRGKSFHADAIPETLRCTTLGGLRPGSRVNLERALRLSDRLGGHLVSGHVDGIGVVREVSSRGGDHRLRIVLDDEWARYVAFKGSVTLQGVSLTVATRSEHDFEVALIPETLARTTLGDCRGGGRVNVEVDLVARYLERLAPGGRTR